MRETSRSLKRRRKCFEIGGKSPLSVTRGEVAVPARSRDTNNSPSAASCGQAHFIDFRGESPFFYLNLLFRLRYPAFRAPLAAGESSQNALSNLNLIKLNFRSRKEVVQFLKIRARK